MISVPIVPFCTVVEEIDKIWFLMINLYAHSLK